MSSYVKRVQAKGIYGRFDIDHTFKPGVNVLHGKNGAGKTTLLHILANVLNGDYELFAFITFDSIRVQLDDLLKLCFTEEEPIKTLLSIYNGQAILKLNFP